ncbi:hypothetical protein PULV_a3348 [Pseudoalteromonas ulvae UL12]|uniref:ABC transporter substrate-binding protein n=1 Tax=Pseudoalteromonas ulvae TaxID=107327 RepID=UPI00186B7B82|nr:ABC transporter substrate-binding protein [Pseudoalteromonas ulvae]MBE0365040.1 hypothetical protein [Pseudoalteromonas ulvae UL12]
MNLIKSLVICFFVFLKCAPANAISVVFINPGHQQENSTGHFWLNVDRFMQAAADDFNIDLKTFFANRDHIYMKSLLLQAIRLKPDFIILVNEKGVGLEMLKMTNQANIPTLFLFNGLRDEDWKNQSHNITEYPFLVASIEPDNYQAGFKLAQELLKQHQIRSNDPAKILALHGDYNTYAAIDRKKGMTDAFNAATIAVEIVGEDVANWSQAQSDTLSQAWLTRFSDINLIWAANDPIAFGAKKASLENYQSRVIGGINWDKKPDFAKDLISIGGHVTLGGYAMAYINDYYHQLLPRQEIALQVDIFERESKQSSKTLISLQNKQQLHKIDFTKFSLQHRTRLIYTIDNLVKAYKH